MIVTIIIRCSDDDDDDEEEDNGSDASDIMNNKYGGKRLELVYNCSIESFVGESPLI